MVSDHALAPSSTLPNSVVGTWRALSQKAHAKGADAKLKDDLAELTKKVEDADAKIREAAKPQKLHFEVVPAPAK